MNENELSFQLPKIGTILEGRAERSEGSTNAPFHRSLVSDWNGKGSSLQHVLHWLSISDEFSIVIWNKLRNRYTIMKNIEIIPFCFLFCQIPKYPPRDTLFLWQRVNHAQSSWTGCSARLSVEVDAWIQLIIDRIQAMTISSSDV